MIASSKKSPIVFFGTPEFAAFILDYLLKEGYNIIAAVTMPDKPAGRGHKLRPSAVKEVANKHKIKVFQPQSLKDEEFIGAMKKLKAELFVVIAFRILPKAVWQIPPKGTFNLHASLLPAYRGAAPINRAIENGEKLTGNTTFLLDEDVDTGNILLQQKVSIYPEDNAGTLHDKLMKQGCELVARTIDGLAEGSLKGGNPQDPTEAQQAPTAPKIFKEELYLHFKELKTEEALLKIRAMSPYPACIMTLCRPEGEQMPFKLFSAMRSADSQGLKPGELRSDGKTYIRIGTADGAIDIMELQAPNKKRMTTSAYLNGCKWSDDSFCL